MGNANDMVERQNKRLAEARRRVDERRKAEREESVRREAEERRRSKERFEKLSAEHRKAELEAYRAERYRQLVESGLLSAEEFEKEWPQMKVAYAVDKAEAARAQAELDSIDIIKGD